jgi:ATP-dependent helicase/nuclease subunit B
MPLRLQFLTWDRPLLERAVAHLAADWSGGTALDLSDRMIVVPTKQAGRRLREALAVHAAERGGAVLAPRVVVPEQILDFALPPSTVVATRAQALMAWAESLRRADLDGLRDVFPSDPPERGFAWALRLAGEMTRLQAALAEGGLRIADVAVRAGAGFEEPRRWEQLARLESDVEARLRAAGLVTTQAAAIAAATAPQPPPDGVAHIAVVGTPDPLPAAMRVLEVWSQTLAVEILVHGPAEERRDLGRALQGAEPDEMPGTALFDEWGRPRPEVWSARAPEVEPFEKRVRLCADPAAQAARIAERLASAGAEGLETCATEGGRNMGLETHATEPRGTIAGVVGVGSADPEVMPLLAGELRAAGVTCHLPEGRPLRRMALAGLLEALLAAVRDDDWTSAAALARRTEVLEFLAREAGEDGAACSPPKLLAGLDALHADHLPPTLAEARRHTGAIEARYPGIGVALERLESLLAELRTGAFPAVWNAVLARLHAGREMDLARPEDRAFAESAEAWRAAADEVAEAAGLAGNMGLKTHATKGDGDTGLEIRATRGTTDRNAALRHGATIDASEACELALQLFGAGRIFDDKPAGAVELDGWLELAFRDEPALLVAGLNDGCAPEAVTGHAFLPESLRERLGLKTNAQRFARDAWQLAALAACREQGGRLEVFLGKTSAAGDPLRPSRLLFQCSDTELPGRVRHLFRELPPEGGNLAWRRAWRWRVPWVGAPARLRVTGFRDYLACPFRFYLKHALGMEPVDAAKRELDPADFGTLVHRVLERLGQDVALRDSTDGEELARAFESALDAVVAARFGGELSLPLLVQVQSARQRLAAVARLQATERAAGWVIQHTEWKLPAGKLAVGGIELSGTIDRIERHEATGAWRVLDYKTSETAKMPAKAHLRPDRDGSARPQAARTEVGGKAHRWTDLQLPLYRWAVGEALGARGATIGYFNLPKAVTETSIAMWEDFDDALQESALCCAEAVGASVKGGRFWPPAEEPENDDFAALVHGSAAESFDVGDWPAEARNAALASSATEESGDRCSSRKQHLFLPVPGGARTAAVAREQRHGNEGAP